MSLDTKERVKYFGQRSDRACGYCRLRNGRSAMRGSKRQDPDIMKLMFRWATVQANTRTTISQRSRARSTLLRHGWNYKRKCRLLQFARTCLVNVTQFPELPYGALCHFERMHTFFIAYCDYLVDLVVSLVRPEMKSKVKRVFKPVFVFSNLCLCFATCVCASIEIMQNRCLCFETQIWLLKSSFCVLQGS